MEPPNPESVHSILKLVMRNPKHKTLDPKAKAKSLDPPNPHVNPTDP